MPAERRFGMDHEHYDWSPQVNRGVLKWPDDARIALCVLVNLEHMEWTSSEGPQTGSLPGGLGGLGPRPYPDYLRVSHREYGHRVGVFRVLDVLDKHGIRPTVAMDVLTAENYPYLVDRCRKSGGEFIGHGISGGRMITGGMSEQEETDYVRSSLERLKAVTGSAPTGWLSSQSGESSRTPQVLAQAGIRYVCDWSNDEQPYPMKTPHGQIYSLPTLLELDDVDAIIGRHMAFDRYGHLLTEAFEVMYGEAARSGRLLVLNLHPWLIGQPFRIGALDDALGQIMRRRGVWAATGSEIVDHYHRNPPAA